MSSARNRAERAAFARSRCPRPPPGRRANAASAYGTMNSANRSLARQRGRQPCRRARRSPQVFSARSCSSRSYSSRSSSSSPIASSPPSSPSRRAQTWRRRAWTSRQTNAPAPGAEPRSQVASANTSSRSSAQEAARGVGRNTLRTLHRAADAGGGCPRACMRLRTSRLRGARAPASAFSSSFRAMNWYHGQSGARQPASTAWSVQKASTRSAAAGRRLRSSATWRTTWKNTHRRSSRSNSHAPSPPPLSRPGLMASVVASASNPISATRLRSICRTARSGCCWKVSSSCHTRSSAVARGTASSLRAHSAMVHRHVWDERPCTAVRLSTCSRRSTSRPASASAAHSSSSHGSSRRNGR